MDAQAFDEQVVIPLAGLPAQSRAVSTMAQWEDRRSGNIERPEGGIGHGQGMAGKLMQSVASVLHWFEEHLVLKGGDTGLVQILRFIGSYLRQIDQLLGNPRYLLLMIIVTFIVIL